MTDLENLQKQESQMEAEQDQRGIEAIKQISELFLTLPPMAQRELLEALREDLYDLTEENDDA